VHWVFGNLRKKTLLHWNFLIVDDAWKKYACTYSLFFWFTWPLEKLTELKWKSIFSQKVFCCHNFRFALHMYICVISSSLCRFADS
jgi:hypothetical protein